MDKILSDLLIRKAIKEKRAKQEYERPSIHLEIDSCHKEIITKKAKEPRRVIIIDL
jgi:hypothetical protein